MNRLFNLVSSITESIIGFIHTLIYYLFESVESLIYVQSQNCRECCLLLTLSIKQKIYHSQYALPKNPKWLNTKNPSCQFCWHSECLSVCSSWCTISGCIVSGVCKTTFLHQLTIPTLSERDIGPGLGFRVWQNNDIEYNLFCLHIRTQLDKATNHYTIEFTQISEWIERRNLEDFRYMGVFGVRSTRKVLPCLFVMAFTSQGKTGEEGRSDWKFEVL